MATRDQLQKLAVLLDEDPEKVDDADVQRRLREKLPGYIAQIPRIYAEQRENARSLANIFGILVPPYQPSKKRGATT